MKRKVWANPIFPNSCILIGMPASGKSTAGRLFAKRLGMAFLDCDRVIEDMTGKKLAKILADEGTNGFQRIENKALLSINAENTVIATGGSAVYCHEGMEHLRTLGKVIFLDISSETAQKRIADINARGVVSKSGQTIADLHRERLPLYRKYADVTVKAGQCGLGELVEKIHEALLYRKKG
ncbi:MAG: shikimate kinase [Oscillospiraceae bacterium]|nr:shikimate kinase [Oscillospiraceae bacterium]